jgi:hypothetical protein
MAVCTIGIVDCTIGKDGECGESGAGVLGLVEMAWRLLYCGVSAAMVE